MHLVVYGDFNCPFSALASDRAERLERTGAVSVDWRAVEHAPGIPLAKAGAGDASPDEIDRELEQVRALLRDGETLDLRRPPRRSDTHAAIQAYAGVEPGRRADVRSALFRAYWVCGQDLEDQRVLVSLGATVPPSDLASSWRTEWLGAGRPIVPMLRLPDGDISRGLGALSRLADLLESVTKRP